MNSKGHKSMATEIRGNLEGLCPLFLPYGSSDDVNLSAEVVCLLLVQQARVVEEVGLGVNHLKPERVTSAGESSQRHKTMSGHVT